MTAPNFGESEFPSSGKRIGPAWEMIWNYLSDKTIPVSKWTIVETILSAGVNLKPKSIESLLSMAGREGYLERTYVGPAKRAHYRRTDVIGTLEGTTK